MLETELRNNSFQHANKPLLSNGKKTSEQKDGCKGFTGRWLGKKINQSTKNDMLRLFNRRGNGVVGLLT